MALHVGLRREKPLASIIAHSGMLVSEEFLAAEIKSRPPILLTHGAIDEVLPVRVLPPAEAALQNVGVDVAAHVLPELGHGIDENTILLDLRFLVQMLSVGSGFGWIHVGSAVRKKAFIKISPCGYLESAHYM